MDDFKRLQDSAPKIHEVGLAGGNQIKIDEDAGVALAAHVAETMKGNIDEHGNPLV